MLDVRWPPFIVRDANGQALAYVYFEENSDEVRLIAAHDTAVGRLEAPFTRLPRRRAPEFYLE